MFITRVELSVEGLSEQVPFLRKLEFFLIPNIPAADFWCGFVTQRFILRKVFQLDIAENVNGTHSSLKLNRDKQYKHRANDIALLTLKTVVFYVQKNRTSKRQHWPTTHRGRKLTSRLG